MKLAWRKTPQLTPDELAWREEIILRVGHRRRGYLEWPDGSTNWYRWTILTHHLRSPLSNLAKYHVELGEGNTLVVTTATPPSLAGLPPEERVFTIQPATEQGVAFWDRKLAAAEAQVKATAESRAQAVARTERLATISGVTTATIEELMGWPGVIEVLIGPGTLKTGQRVPNGLLGFVLAPVEIHTSRDPATDLYGWTTPLSFLMTPIGIPSSTVGNYHPHIFEGAGHTCWGSGGSAISRIRGEGDIRGLVRTMQVLTIGIDTLGHTQWRQPALAYWVAQWKLHYQGEPSAYDFVKDVQHNLTGEFIPLEKSGLVSPAHLLVASHTPGGVVAVSQALLTRLDGVEGLPEALANGICLDQVQRLLTMSPAAYTRWQAEASGTPIEPPDKFVVLAKVPGWFLPPTTIYQCHLCGESAVFVSSMGDYRCAWCPLPNPGVPANQIDRRFPGYVRTSGAYHCEYHTSSSMCRSRDKVWLRQRGEFGREYRPYLCEKHIAQLYKGPATDQGPVPPTPPEVWPGVPDTEAPTPEPVVLPSRNEYQPETNVGYCCEYPNRGVYILGTGACRAPAVWQYNLSAVRPLNTEIPYWLCEKHYQELVAIPLPPVPTPTPRTEPEMRAGLPPLEVEAIVKSTEERVAAPAGPAIGTAPTADVTVGTPV